MRRFANLLAMVLLGVVLVGCGNSKACTCPGLAVSCRGGQEERSQDVNYMFGTSNRPSLGGW